MDSHVEPCSKHAVCSPFESFVQPFEGIALNGFNDSFPIRTPVEAGVLSIPNEAKHEEISGNTLRVYWYVLKSKDGCGVREVQRALGFSSSSTAHYHLEKLADKRFLIRNEYGSYQVNGKVKSGMISPFVVVRGLIFPRQLLYAAVNTLFDALFLIFLWKFLSVTVVLALIPGVLACAIFWYETIRLWPSLPSFDGDVR